MEGDLNTVCWMFENRVFVVFWGSICSSSLQTIKQRFDGCLLIFKRSHEVKGMEQFFVVQQDSNKRMGYTEMRSFNELL